DRREVPLNPCLRQLYTGELFRGCRLYPIGPLTVQGITKEQRRTARIDGERTAYLDFKAYATRMHYNLEGVDPDRDEDVYKPEAVFPRSYASTRSKLEQDVVRSFVKTVTNVCWNVST